MAGFFAGMVNYTFDANDPSGITTNSNYPDRMLMHNVEITDLDPATPRQWSYSESNDTFYLAGYPPAGYTYDEFWYNVTGVWTTSSPYAIIWITNCTQYDPVNHTPLSGLQYDSYQYYEDYIMVYYNMNSVFPIWGWNTWWKPISYEQIIAHAEDHDSYVDIQDQNNVSVHFNFGEGYDDMADALANYADLNISMIRAYNETFDPLGTIWKILTFDASWMGEGSMFISYLISIVVDFIIILAVVRFVQGFIP